MTVGDIYLVYDGHCPLCSAYSQAAQIRQDFGALHLLDARQGGAIVEEIRLRGLDLNTGMVLKLGTQFYHGAAAMQKLSSISSRNSWFNRVNYWIFKSEFRATTLYPLLRFGRGLLLKLLGRRPIDVE